jgi:hypothetical protein
MPLTPAPLINGFKYDWSSITIRVFGQSLDNSFRKISYENEKDGRKHVYGKGKNPIAQTRGRNKPAASAEMYKSDFIVLTELLGDDYGDEHFDIVISYSDEGKVLTDQLIGCTMTKHGDDHEQGGDELFVAIDLMPTSIIINGRNF